MNAKHPIDDLFARGLRDAEATPPPAAWEGIMLGHGRARQARKRRRAGLFTLLALALFGTGAHFVLKGTRDAQEAQMPTMEERATENAITEPSYGPAIANAEIAARGSTAIDTAAHTSTPVSESLSSRPLHASTAPINEQRSSDPPQETRRVAQPVSPKNQGPIAPSPTRGDRSSLAYAAAPGTADPKPVSTVTSHAVTAGPSFATEHDRPIDAVDSAPSHMFVRSAGLVLDSLAPTVRSNAQQPVFLLSKGATWLGVQASWSNPAMRWNGGSEDLAILNKSESWSAQTGLGVVLGRTWQGGWFAEVGARYSRVSSNLFYTERTPASTQTVVDTTWTATQADQFTVYTWNIVTNSMENPGSEIRFDAQNRYDLLRVAPAVGYQKQWRRLNLSMRAGPMLSLFLARSGKTLMVSDDPEPGASRLALIPLNDGALDERFRPQWGFSFGLDLGYTITERWSISAGPSRIMTLTDRTGSLGGDGWSANLRLIHEFRQNERRTR